MQKSWFLVTLGLTIAPATLGNAEPSLKYATEDARIVGQALAQATPPASTSKKRPAPSTQIACTRVGCNPIPPGCQIEKEFGWDGLPTGYDLVVCPRR
jgi:hypothetical protein